MTKDYDTDEFIELTYVGGLELEKIMFRRSAISCIQKPKSDKFGSIVVLNTGDKFPVKETYDFLCHG